MPMINGLNNHINKTLDEWMMNNKNPDDIDVPEDLVCLTVEQMNKGVKNINKGPLGNLIVKLLSAVMSVCAPEYKVTNQPRHKSVEAFVAEKLDRVHDSFKSNFYVIKNKLNMLSGSLE